MAGTPLREHLFSGEGKVRFFDPTTIDPALALYALLLVASVISLLALVQYRYQRWKRFKALEDEMKAIGLDAEQENALSRVVLNYKMERPVDVVKSVRLFDELASEEMARVLGSPGSATAKRDYINTLYEIRTRTFHPDWMRN